MISPEIRELQIFLALVKTGSFSAAAQQMGITQPAVSAQIVKLEQMIGFPLFYRAHDGTALTEQGQILVPLAEDSVREYNSLLSRAAYWKRSRTNQVKIWSDGSRLAQEVWTPKQASGNVMEAWQDIGAGNDWRGALQNLEVDIVLAGSFLKAGDVPGLKTAAVRQQRGVTIAWNPTYYVFDPESFSLPIAVSSTLILPAPSLVIGFREFLSQWCKMVYGLVMEEMIECRSEFDAVNACKLGLGVLIFPGDAEERMRLHQEGLQTVRAFEFILPKAFTYGIRYRADEQNPQILSTVAKLLDELGKQSC